MSRLILCYNKEAEVPYYLETIGKNIHTIEELCYYFREYAHLLDESALDVSLASWISEELAMEELAGRVKQIITDSEDVEELAKAVLNSIHYLSEQELAAYMQNLKKMKHMSAFERSKRKADDLVMNEKYYKAIREYKRLLEEPEAEDDQMASKIYHNMGVAYSRMFFFKKGSECFLKAFLGVPNRESMRQYKLSVRLCEDQIEEDELVKQFPGSESMDLQVYQDMQSVMANSEEKCHEIEELKQLKNEGKVAEYYNKLREILQTWRDQCRESMN